MNIQTTKSMTNIFNDIKKLVDSSNFDYLCQFIEFTKGRISREQEVQLRELVKEFTSTSLTKRRPIRPLETPASEEDDEPSEEEGTDLMDLDHDDDEGHTDDEDIVMDEDYVPEEEVGDALFYGPYTDPDI